MESVEKPLKKHILVITQYFYPEQFRINDICSEWIARGYEVTVITGIPNYPKGKYYEGYGLFKRRNETYNGIRIKRIPLIPRGHNTIMLALNYMSFVVSGFFWKTFTSIRADYVFVFEVSPMTQALPGIWFAKKRKIPCFLYVQDLWPENVEVITGVRNRFIIDGIGKMVDYIYKRCTRIFTTSKSFIGSIHHRKVSLDKLVYWPQYAEDFYLPLERTGIPEIPDDGAFNIIFAGNIGNAQGLDILPRTAAILMGKCSVRKTRFNIVGDGRYKSELIRTVDSMNIGSMFHFIEKQPEQRIPEFMAACDAAFLSLVDSPLFAMTIPAKIQSYMACGIPILAAAAGETSNIINDSSAGACSSPGDAEALARIILEFMNKPTDELRKFGANARAYYDMNFNKQKLLDQMDEYFNNSSMEENAHVSR